MKPAFRIARKWSLRLIAAFFIVIALQLSILAFPQPFFSTKFKAEFGTIYSDKDADPDLQEIAAAVADRLKAVGNFRAGEAGRIFVCNNRTLFNFFARLSLVTISAQGYNLSIFGNSFISASRIDQLRAASGGFPPYAINEGDPAHTITHEIIHQFMADALGQMAYRKIPPLKAEGYAEYGSSIARIKEDSVNTLPHRIGLLLDDNNWRPGRDRVREHYRAGLTVEFLSEIKGYGFAEVMDNNVSLDDAYGEMIRWYQDKIKAGSGIYP